LGSDQPILFHLPQRVADLAGMGTPEVGGGMIDRLFYVVTGHGLFIQKSRQDILDPAFILKTYPKIIMGQR
jgi:hypothetical protein